MRIKYPTTSKVTLLGILKKRKSSLKQWSSEVGISSYASVLDWCKNIGVVPPDKSVWEDELTTKDSLKDSLRVTSVHPEVSLIKLDETLTDLTVSTVVEEDEKVFVTEKFCVDKEENQFEEEFEKKISTGAGGKTSRKQKLNH